MLIKETNQSFVLNMVAAGSFETTLCMELHDVTFHNGRLNFRLQVYFKSHIIEIKCVTLAIHL
jgi:hypothetical protein